MFIMVKVNITFLLYNQKLIPSNEVSHGIRRSKISQNNYSLSPSSQENLLTPSEVAALFRVDPKTVTRWAKAGKLTSIKTLGGHRRYKESEVRSLLKSISLDTPNSSNTNQ